MKKVISTILTVAMLIAVCPMCVVNAATSGTCGDNVKWTLDDAGTLTISGTGAMRDWPYNNSSPFYRNINIQSVIINKGVTSIGKYAFYGCYYLTSVTIPSSVTSIGEDAFYDCSGLTSVTIPDSVTSIGDDAFYNTAYYSNEANWDNGVLYIGKHLIKANSYKISNEYIIKQGTKTIADYAFDRCSRLTSVTIPDSVTSIGDLAFFACSGLTSVTIPDSVTSIGIYAFYGCSGITSITIGNRVTSIGNYAFAGCGSLKDVYYCGNGDSWNKINIGLYNEALKGAAIHYITDGKCGDNLTWSLDSKDTLIIIGTGNMTDYLNSPFYGHTNIKSVVIEKGVTSIGNNAFNGCNVLDDVYYFGTQEDWSKITIGENNENLTNAEIHYMPEIYSGTDGSINWTAENNELIISGSESIPDYDKFGAQWYPIRNQITKITIEDGIDTIGANAFNDFANVENVSIPPSVIQINSGAFANCTSLKSIALPLGMTGGIGSGAFENCIGLTLFNVPSGVTAMEQGVFEGCINLTEITLPFIGSMPGESNTKNTFSYIFNGSVPSTLKKVTITNETHVPENAFQNCEHIEIININDSITSIGSGAFDGCKSLKSFDVPKNIVTIGDNTFRNCEKAIRITIPDTVKEIGEGAFNGCKSITEFTIPSGISALENSTFANCASLAEIEIPLSVTYIGKGVLQNCNRLVDVKVPFVGANADPALSDTELKKSFGHIFGVSNKNIPPSVTKVEITGTDLTMYIPDNAFKDCGNVADIIIDGGRSIGNYAFANCKNLKNVYIPKSIKNMGNKILQGCTRIETLVVPFIGINRQDANTETSVIGALFGWDDQDIATGTRQYYDNNKSSHLYQIPPTLKNVSVLNQTNIPAGAFSECSLENVSIISGAVMNDYVFYNCTELKKVSLPSNMTNIGVEAFAECEKLETINIPTKVKKIGDHAFYGARGLKDVTMPDSITEFAEDIFDSSIALFSVDEVNLLSDDGCVITCAKDSAAYNYAVKKGIKTNVVSADKLDKRSTATSVSLLSDNSYLFDITDSYSMSGVLHIDLYNANADIVKKREQAVNGADVEYKAEFSEEDMRGVSFAKIYITDIQGGRVSKTDEIISVDGGEIPIIPESDIEIVYHDGLISFDGTTSIKAGSVLIQAIYDGDVLHSVTEYPVSSSSDIIEVNTDFARGSSKFMLWNGLDKMKPLTNFIVE